MNGHVATTLALYGVFLAAWCAIVGLRRRAPSPAFTVAAVALEVTLALQAAVDLGVIAFGGRHPVHLAVHLAYLLCSVALLPAFVNGTIGRKSDAPGAVLLLAGGCLLTAIVTARLYLTSYPLTST